jgi:glutamate formiminotransferase / formiminotetrahydrofolate cyclodeaminase
VNLNSANLGIAKHIAKRIRFSSGGFRYVKAMGVLLKDRNQAQVSMNLTDFEHTSMELVLETVRREAERYGVTIGSSEIVGLVPQKALERAAEFYLQVENFKPEMVLENRLEQVMSTSSSSMADSIRPVVNRVASADPVPGGGSVSALTGALGAALGQMAIRITQEKKSFQQHADRYTDALDRLAPYTSALLELVDADSEAYSRVMAAYKLPKGSMDRDKAVQDGLTRATEIPSRTANCAAEALRVLEELRSIIHANVASDLQVGMQMLRASLRGAISNIRTNLSDIKDANVRIRYEDMIVSWEQTLRGSS